MTTAVNLGRGTSLRYGDRSEAGFGGAEGIGPANHSLAAAHGRLRTPGVLKESHFTGRGLPKGAAYGDGRQGDRKQNQAVAVIQAKKGSPR